MSKTDRQTNIYLAIGTFSFFGIIILYVLEFPYFSNTLQIGHLVRNSFIAAAIIATPLLIFGYFKKHLDTKDIRIHIFLYISFLLFAPFFASFSNRKLAFAPPYSESYEYIGQKGYYIQMFGKEKGQTADTYWIYLRKNGQNYSFRTKGKMPKKIAGTGSNVRLVMKKGLWGYDFFDGLSWEFI